MKKKMTQEQKKVSEIFRNEYLWVKFEKGKLVIEGKDSGQPERIFRESVEKCLKEISGILKFKKEFEISNDKKEWPEQSWFRTEIKLEV